MKTIAFLLLLATGNPVVAILYAILCVILAVARS